MNILIVGSGAREHAIAKVLCRTSPDALIFCYGNSHNPGIRQLASQYLCADLQDLDRIAQSAQAWKIEMAIIGPEAPLEQGLADRLTQIGIATVGPTRDLARIESSKSFTRHLLQQYQIPGSPLFRFFHNMNGAAAFLQELGEHHYVIKADGLMGGKGVKVAGDHLHSITDALAFCQELTDAGLPFLIEEKLEGQEFSLLCFTDGNCLIPMPLVQDHKRAFDQDKGPNTGGMGSYSCADHSLPFLKPGDLQSAMAINQQVLQALQTECRQRYKGILYSSFMATRDGVKLIEYNARFGDPEAINILSLFDQDFAALCWAISQGSLTDEHVRFKALATVCKYAVPMGYPDLSLKNIPLDVSAIQNPDCLYYAAVNEQEGQLIATGSRTIAVLGQASTLAEAEKLAEAEISRIEGEFFYRRDIGSADLIKQRIDHMKRLRQESAAHA